MATLTDGTEGNEEVAASRGASGVIVLGTGRSGTSAIARAFVSGGFFAGRDEDLLGPTPFNPTGHYEPLSVLRTNEEILERLGCSWWSDTPTPEEQLPLRPELEPRLRSILESLIEKAGGAPVVVKEPRINGLLPLWQPVIDGVLHPVLTVRDPLEIALSHEHRDGTSLGHALAAWEVQTTMVLRWLDGRTATIAPYEQLTAQPELAAGLVRDAASHLDPTLAKGVLPVDASSALRPDLRRQSAAGLAHADHLTGRQAALWRYLETLPAGDARLKVPMQVRQPSNAARAALQKESERVQLAQTHATLSAEYTEAMTRLTELEERFAKAHHAALGAAKAEERHARELESIEASASWRITAPLRRAAQTLRLRSRA